MSFVARVRDLRPGLLLVAALLAFVGVVHGLGMGTWPAHSEDEGTYVSQAWAVLEWQRLTHYVYWYDHPPLGWLLVAFWGWVTGAFDRTASAVVAGRELMLVAHVVSAALLYTLARRLELTRVAAAGAVLLFSLTPLAVYHQRQVLLDNLALPFVLGAFVLALSPGRRLWAFAASGALFGCAVLTKETMLIVLPALVLLAWRNADPRTRRFCMTVFSALLVLTVSIYALYAALKSELVPGEGHVSLIDGIRFQLFSRAPSGSIFDQHSEAHQIVTGWLARDASLLLASVALAPAALAIRRLRPVGIAYALLVLMLARPGYLPGVYVIAMLPFASLVVAGVADAAWKWPSPPELRRSSRTGWPFRVWPHQAAVAAVAVAGLAILAPQWVSENVNRVAAPEETPFEQAKQWLFENVERDSTLLVEEPFWLDLVRGGFEPDRVVWFYKLDLDPEIAARFPGGWRHFDYVVSGGLQSSLMRLPTSRAALENSTVVATFANEHERREIRQVHHTGVWSNPDLRVPIPASPTW
jgi:4-amino-4-deoxy-L-arabinose transferase-like glycosyltransferase